MKKGIQDMLAYCKQISAEKLTKLGDCISIRDGEGMLITASAKVLESITEKDIIEINKNSKMDNKQALHMAIYAERPETNAIITNHAPYCAMVATNQNKLVACLDDMAQIIGSTAKVAKSDDAAKILATLKGRNACLIRGSGVIATGRTLDEAHTGTLVLEKGARAHVEATILGGAVKIPLLEAKLMRFIYKTKYSKADQTAKMEDAK